MRARTSSKPIKVPRWRLALSAALIAIVLTVLVALLVLARGVGATRTIVIDAVTSSIEIHFSGDADYWDFGTATICIPLQKLNLSARPESNKCDPRRYRQEHGEVAIAWQNNARATVMSDFADGWVVEIQEHSDYADGTKILVDQDTIRSIGVISFSGSAYLGQVAATGETSLLISGSYQLREKPFLSDSTETLKVGTFRPGERVGILRTDHEVVAPARVYGYIMPVRNKVNSFQASIISEPGPSKVSISYFGGKVPVDIAPNWIDRAIASPLILALSVLIPIILTVSQFLILATNTLNLSAFATVHRGVLRIASLWNSR